ncbi:hypothetical protein H5410_061713 [Solanum commersonii]|uniref:Uncharacterized protein n=1 Tax=Solanum commersonii TaxID=4109 RepID=A0A9J5W8G7_SOLCO|nr:hypothetical protein H5410_061713 [Solanum commersonii]
MEHAALSSSHPFYWDSSLRALPALSNKKFRLGPGKRWQQLKGRGPCSCCDGFCHVKVVNCLSGLG